MARLLEHGVKTLLAGRDLHVPQHRRAESVEEVLEATGTLGLPVVLKALVPGGRRGKAGAVRICRSEAEVQENAAALLGTQLGAFPVDALLVEELVDIRRELYVAIEIARGRPEYTLLLSAYGGVEIESHPESVATHRLDPNDLPDSDVLAGLWHQLDGTLPVKDLGHIVAELLAVFVERDLTLLEINPLSVLADDSIVSVGALAAIDDNALARQPLPDGSFVEGSDRSWRPETPLEARVAAINADTTQRGSARYLELEGGNIGFLCGGGGASLLLFDAVVAAGGQPANYSEFGGNPTEQRVYDLTRVALDKPGVQGLFVAHNITNNTQVDVVAAGVTRALDDANLPADFPVVAREAGLHDAEGRRIFEAAGVRYFGEETSLDAAAREMVGAMRESGIV